MPRGKQSRLQSPARFVRAWSEPHLSIIARLVGKERRGVSNLPLHLLWLNKDTRTFSQARRYMKELRDMLMDQLKDAHSAERQAIQAMKRTLRKASDPS